jgi:hypothetical protein
MLPFHGNNQLAHALIKAATTTPTPPTPTKRTNHILATKILNVAVSNHKQALAFNAFKSSLKNGLNGLSVQVQEE